MVTVPQLSAADTELIQLVMSASSVRLLHSASKVVMGINTGNVVSTMVMVLVGAINVAAIETVWSGLVTPPRGKKISEYDYSHTSKEIAKGKEMGRFNMGSTVILLTGNNVEWLPHISAGQPVKMGQMIGHFPV